MDTKRRASASASHGPLFHFWSVIRIGRTVYRYADEILGLDRELLEAVKGRPTRPGRLAVGVTNVVPKLVAYQMLEPALRLLEPIRVDCVEYRL
jgi:LysR family transcriptional activator of nhaA